jgi:WD40 repeat protein
MAMMQLQRRQTYSQAATANVRRDTGGGGYTVHAMGVDTRTNKASLFAGTADGHVSAWHMESASSNDKPWATFVVKPRCGLKVMEYIKDYNVLLTGSTDGTMAIWDPWTRSKSNADSFLCIQNLVGHVGSVTDATYVDDCIVSSGTDLTIKFWKVESGREMLQYPWFKCGQSVKLDCWPTAVSGTMLRGIDKRQIFVGTTDGSLHRFDSVDQIDSNDYASQQRQYKFVQTPIGTRSSFSRSMHTLGITSMLLVPAENLLVTLGYDQVVKVIETETLALVFTTTNKHGRFSGLAWDTEQRMLFLTDESGRIGIYNVFTGKLLKEEQVSANQHLCGVSIVPRSQRILLLDRGQATVWSIDQQQQGLDNFEGHTGVSSAYRAQCCCICMRCFHTCR